MRTAFLELHYSNTTGAPSSGTTGRPVYDSITAILNNTGDTIKLDKPFSMQAIVTSNGTVIDTLLDLAESERPTLMLTSPLFPQCFSDKTANTGDNVTLEVSDLLPNASINTFLGAREVATGATTSTGDGTIHFTIPDTTSSGLHLITVGVDDTAFGGRL